MAALQDAKYGLYLIIIYQYRYVGRIKPHKTSKLSKTKLWQILNKYHMNAVIFHSGSCSCNNWKLMTSDPAETLEFLMESTPVLRFVYTFAI